MSAIRTMLVVALASLLMSACGTAGFIPDHASQDLAVGIRFYEEGDYVTATTVIQHALADGLSNKKDMARAYKYMAFIHCVSDREKQCRDEFKKALEIDPSFDLRPEEAGHPVWGPVFRSVKLKPSK